MKKNELTKLIKDAVKQAIREELGSELKALKEIRSNSKKIVENTKIKPTKRINKNISYSKNPVLNDMLKEMEAEFDKGSWERENQTSEEEIITENREPITIDNVNPAVIPEPVKMALNKDYSQLMKKLNDERGVTK
ncbi:MAG: hypothetical protein H8E98_02960 [Bacteroidetes bacterium]|nr:hypothetical protein [Bacteroidota bacterium]